MPATYHSVCQLFPILPSLHIGTHCSTSHSYPKPSDTCPKSCGTYTSPLWHITKPFAFNLEKFTPDRIFYTGSAVVPMNCEKQSPPCSCTHLKLWSMSASSLLLTPERGFVAVPAVVPMLWTVIHAVSLENPVMAVINKEGREGNYRHWTLATLQSPQHRLSPPLNYQSHLDYGSL